MLGALLGDLAAWTYSHKRESFEKHEIHKDARISECGLGLLATSRKICEALKCKPESVGTRNFSDVETYVDSMPLKLGNYEIYEELTDEEIAQGKSTARLFSNLILGSIINEGAHIEPTYDQDGFACWHSNEWMGVLHAEKCDFYTSQMSVIIARLRSGASKERAIEGTAFIKVADGENSPLGYVSQVWECFEKSTDYWSAVTSAIQQVDYPYTHKAAALTGALAGAFYGTPEFVMPEWVAKYFYNEIELLKSPDAKVARFVEIDLLQNAEMPKENWQSMFLFMLDVCPSVYDYMELHRIEVKDIKGVWKGFFVQLADDKAEVRQFIKDYYEDFYYQDEQTLALRLAQKAFEGMTDLDGKPTVDHSIAVSTRCDRDEEKVVAYLHDVVEDTEYTFDDLAKMRFRKETIASLRLLTHSKEQPYEEYITNIAESGDDCAVAVKVNDLCHNLERGSYGIHIKQAKKHAKACKLLIQLLEQQPTCLYERRDELIKKLNGVLEETQGLRDLYETMPEKSEILLKSAVAGWSWNDGDLVWNQLKEGKKLRLIREPANTHDANAVAVYFSNTKLGYIPKQDNEALAKLLDEGQGQSLKAHILVKYESEEHYRSLKLFIYKNSAL